MAVDKNLMGNAKHDKPNQKLGPDLKFRDPKLSNTIGSNHRHQKKPRPKPSQQSQTGGDDSPPDNPGSAKKRSFEDYKDDDDDQDGEEKLPPLPQTPPPSKTCNCGCHGQTRCAVPSSPVRSSGEHSKPRLAVRGSDKQFRPVSRDLIQRGVLQGIRRAAEQFCRYCSCMQSADDEGPAGKKSKTGSLLPDSPLASTISTSALQQALVQNTATAGSKPSSPSGTPLLTASMTTSTTTSTTTSSNTSSNTCSSNSSGSSSPSRSSHGYFPRSSRSSSATSDSEPDSPPPRVLEFKGPAGETYNPWFRR